MGGFDRRGYMPPTRESEPESKLDVIGVLGRPLLIVAVVGVVLFGGYKLVKSANAASDNATSNAQIVQMGQRIADLEHRLEQMEKERKVTKEPSRPAAPTPVVAVAEKPAPLKHQLAFSRPVSAPAAPSSPANAVANLSANASPTSASTTQSDLTALRAANDTTQQQWVATADRLGNVVGELDSQRDAIARDQARLDELAARFERDSQPFTLEKSSEPQQVGPVMLRLQGTDLRNQRYTMRLSVDDATVELKDRALHEAIQIYASGGKLTFELVVSQIGRDVVSGRLVLPQSQTTVTR